jgi:hypothetical protein
MIRGDSALAIPSWLKDDLRRLGGEMSVAKRRVALPLALAADAALRTPHGPHMGRGEGHALRLIALRRVTLADHHRLMTTLRVIRRQRRPL